MNEESLGLCEDEERHGLGIIHEPQEEEKGELEVKKK